MTCGADQAFYDPAIMSWRTAALAASPLSRSKSLSQTLVIELPADAAA